MRRLVGQIRPYAWGSRTAIARIQGRPTPTPAPEAELWWGAHPLAPSYLVDGDTRRSLLAEVEADPVGMLGERVAGRYGPRLPFLVKLLAAEEPLSLQAHPDDARAREGYAAEEAAVVPRDAPQRNYRDPYHKPELLVALTGFEALCGFRRAADAARLLERLGVPELRPIVDLLRGADPRRGLRRALTALFAVPDATRPALVARVRDACTGLGPEPEYAVAARLAERHPGDIGVVVSFLLNLVRLEPGEAIYMPAGNLHAYLSGVGLEVMACSDNVLRGGLTGKHVDVAQLLRVLRFEELPDARLSPLRAADGVLWWPVPVPDFRLTRAVVDGGPVTLPLPDGPSPRIVCCLSGPVRVADPRTGLEVTAGEAVFVPAGSGPVTVTGSGEVYQVSVG